MESIFFMRFTIIILVALFSWNCSKDSNPMIQNNWQNDEELFSGNLEIKTEKLTYTLKEISAEDLTVIVATLTNLSEDTLYTKLGDRINENIDQDYISIAKWTDGYFEKNVSKNKWDNLNLSTMVEGSKIIRILPSKKYKVIASAYLDFTIEGSYRLKVNYYKNYTQNIIDTLTDVSNTFFIIKSKTT